MLKRNVPLLITGLIGVFLIVANFFPSLSAMSEDFTVFFGIIAAMAFVLGGGTDVLVKMRTGLIEPDLLVDIKAFRR